MARLTARRTLIWHLGLPHAPREVVPASLEAHREALAAAGVLVGASADEATAATQELLRTHREAGLRRRDVEGTWARVCARVWDHKGVAVLSTPDLTAADADAVRLALDPLRGVEVHLVLGVESFSAMVQGAWLAALRTGATTGLEKYAARVLVAPGSSAGADGHPQHAAFWAGHDLPEVLARWGWTLHDERVHVVADRDPRATWDRVVELAGLDPVALPAEVPATADPAGAAVLRRVNRELGRAVDDSAGGAGARARELARLVGSGSTLLLDRETAPSSSVAPVAGTDVLRPVVEGWVERLGGSAYDLRGDLLGLLDGPADDAVTTPPRRDQLAVAVDRLAEVLGENAALRREVAELRAAAERSSETPRKRGSRLRAVG